MASSLEANDDGRREPPPEPPEPAAPPSAENTRATLEDVTSPRIVHLGFGAAAVRYEDAWAQQRKFHAAVADAGSADGVSIQDADGVVLLLEHQPVYTAGKRTNSWERPTDGTPVVEVDRGGRITWHGPGQLTGYPILRLAEPMDVVAYVRGLEEMLIGVCADVGLIADRVEGRSGVWVLGGGSVPDRKVAAIGVRVARGVTMHGFALNCDCDLDWYSKIVACGLPDAEVTSLTAELGRKVTVQDVLPLVEQRVGDLATPRTLAR